MQGLGGLISGIDTASLVQAMLQTQRIPIVQWQNEKLEADIKISRVGEYMSRLNTLKDTLNDSFGSIGEILALQSEASDEDKLSVTSTGEASPGNYEVTVTSLASYEKDRSDAFAGAFGEVKEGTLSIGSGPDSTNTWVDITIEDGDTLEDVAEKINASDALVNASIVSDGTSSYLQLTAQKNGFDPDGTADQAIRIQETYTGSAGQELNLTQISTATNAVATVDGLSITSRDNNLNDILPGVDITLKAVGTSSFDISKDKEGTRENLQAFVDAYNAVAELIDQELNIDADQDRDRSLSGDFVIRTLQNDLAQAVSQTFGDTDFENTFESLAAIGINRGDGGKLTIDASAMDDALDTDMVAVARMFTTSNGVVDKVSSLVDEYTSGSDSMLGARKDSLEESKERIDTRIERLETRLERSQETIERQFMAMELAMAEAQQQTGALMSVILGSMNQGSSGGS